MSRPMPSSARSSHASTPSGPGSAPSGHGSTRSGPGPTPQLPAPSAVQPMGSTALLARYEDTATVLAAAEAIRTAAPAGTLCEAVPAEDALLLMAADRLDLPALRDLLDRLPAPDAATAHRPPVTIDVVYDGEDLETTARLLAMSTDALVTAHLGTTWRAAFAGFAPGFAYLLPVSDPVSASRAPHPSVGPVAPVPAHHSPPWSVPRREQPRTRVPAGAVALAADYCGIYPRSSPGGWQLIGRTDAVLFDPHADSPALLAPGTEVRFRSTREVLRLWDLPDGGVIAQATSLWESARRQVTEAVRQAADSARLAADSARLAAGSALRAAIGEEPSAPPHPDAAASVVADLARALIRVPTQDSDPALEVLEAGPLTLVQDDGRPGHASIGVTRSGAFDRSALRRANRAVGNPPSAAALEILAGPFAVTALAPAVVAIDGAGASIRVRRAVLAASADGDSPDQPGDLDVTDGAAMGPIALDAGDVLRIGTARTGLRIVLALRGGVHVEPVLGSRSRDTLAELGPLPLQRGEMIRRCRDTVLGPVTDMTGTGDLMDVAGLRGLLHRMGTEEADGAAPGDTLPTIDVPLTVGPHDDLLGTVAVAALLETTWTVRPDSDRVGVRLAGEPLPMSTQSAAATMPSTPMVPGAIQVPPSGLPVVFGPDHPVTGGYPVIAVVTRRGLNRLAQAAPGRRVRFVEEQR